MVSQEKVNGDENETGDPKRNIDGVVDLAPV
jgi:hypothetical protein